MAMTPQERIVPAKDLMRLANTQPGLTAQQRRNARRSASNLLKINEYRASKTKA